MTIEELRKDYDWKEAFEVAARDGIEFMNELEPTEAPTLSDVASILNLCQGENDTSSWIGVFLLSDGRFLYVTAWCDYTGWGCQDGGHMALAKDYATIVRFALTKEDRERFGLPEPEAIEA